MSNVIFSPFYKSHPVFKADQVLSDVHLNGMLEYLEKENLQTRSQLIGSGIFEGFTFQINKEEEITTLSVSNGKGVTSTGQLIIQAQKSGFINHSYAIQYEPDHLEEEFPHLPENSIIYALIPDRPDAPEALEGIVSIGSLLDKNLDTGLAALQETVDIQVQSCFVTNCDERGAQRKFAIKYLLIQVPESSPSQQPDHQPTLRSIERWHIEASNSPELLQAYSKVCSNEYLDWLLGEILAIKNQLVPGLRQFTTVAEINTNGLNLKGKRDRVLEDKPNQVQYFYDFLIDLGQTLEEIIRLQHSLKDKLHPLTHHYPRHLMLGQIKGQKTAFNKNYFQPAIPNQQEAERMKELARCCDRLGTMLDTFSIPGKAESILITPTRSRTYPIRDASVPFYYRMPDKPVTWNALGNDTGSLTSGLLDRFHDDRDALLVEGIIGLNKNKAIESLQELKRKHHLSTALVVLRISEVDHAEAYPLPKKPEPGSISEFNFKEFLIEHPGLFHGSAVPKGGTLAVVFKAEPGNTDGPVVATLILPYVCCGRKQAAPEPEPFILKAVGDQNSLLAGKSIDIAVLDNDQFDNGSPIEVDFVYDLAATNDQKPAVTGKQIDIKSLQNDLFDRDAPIEVDLIDELDAKNVDSQTLTNKSIDIDVLKNDNIAPGPIELDFDKDN